MIISTWKLVVIIYGILFVGGFLYQISRKGIIEFINEETNKWFPNWFIILIIFITNVIFLSGFISIIKGCIRATIILLCYYRINRITKRLKIGKGATGDIEKLFQLTQRLVELEKL
jgi:hypothetical protein